MLQLGKVVEWMPAWRGDETVIAVAGSEVVDRHHFQARVADVAARLQAISARRWALTAKSPSNVAVGVCAGLIAGREIVVLPDEQPAVLERLGQVAEGLMTDDPTAQFAGAVCRLGFWRDGLELTSTRPANLTSALLLYTSGSAGGARLVHKPISIIDAEIETLEHAFGQEMMDARIQGTVAPLHIYGLLFRVLWPLAAGRVFADDTVGSPNDLDRLLDPTTPSVVVSGPAFLERVAPLLDTSRLVRACRWLFSSDGPLSAPVAASLNGAIGGRLVEIYGSTETGGIAWRVEKDPSGTTPWQPFDRVHALVSDGKLQVSSPHIEGGAFLPTGDLAEMTHNGRFRIVGRYDPIVTLAEKRLYLTHVERTLEDSDLVAQACVAVFAFGNRQRLSAAIVPTDAGWREIVDAGRRAFIDRLTALLAHDFEPECRPRNWRFVTRLPENGMSKVDTSRVGQFLDPQRNEIELPEVTKIEVTGSHLSAEIRVPENLCYLEGHFPGEPVVAGVVQLAWVCQMAARHLHIASPWTSIKALKFRRVIRPGDHLVLALDYDKEKHNLSFTLSADQQPVSSGKIGF